MRVDDFDFYLPPDLIAQHPPAERDGARMLAVDRVSGALKNLRFRDFPAMLRPDDLLIMNDSRVIPARLLGRRAGLHTQKSSPAPSGQVEVLLTRQLDDRKWLALVKPARKVPVGERIVFGSAPNLLTADVIQAGEFGERTLRFESAEDFFGTLERIGHIPLPPYIHRDPSAEHETDRARYQTVYAGQHGSAAAPTAGLHFTPAVLNAVKARGIQVAYVTLHVGLGTFQPVRADDLSDIRLHEESYTLPASTANAIRSARLEGRRIVAVGTTTTRTLEHIAQTGRHQAHTGSTSIFLRPGYRFQLVDALLTNFHLPRSTLLMLVSAFAGREHVLDAYLHAVQERYRFFSYGDCMFLS